MNSVTKFALGMLLIAVGVSAQQVDDFEIELSDTHLMVVTAQHQGVPVSGLNQSLNARIDGTDLELVFTAGRAAHQYQDAPNIIQITLADKDFRRSKLYISDGNSVTGVRGIPMWLSILPPLIAIGFALIFREVLLALFAGVWIGAFITVGFSFKSVFTGFLAAGQVYVVNALADPDHMAVIVFSMLIGGMVAIVSRNGGMLGIVKWLSAYAKSNRSSQLVTWALGIAIFFDDYANTLIVGNTMRPVTDAHRVSREKLAYLVDSTAAPVAAIAFVTTWVGAELGYIENATATLGFSEGAYSMFINSLAYAYYPVLTLGFIGMLVWMRRDFGPMWKAENRALTTGDVTGVMAEDASGREMIDESLDDFNPVDPSRANAFNALVPVLIVVLGTVLGLLVTGYDAATWHDPALGLFRKLSIIIGDSDSYKALMWSSLTSVAVAFAMTWAQRIMRLPDIVESLLLGFKTMMPAILILVLAWSLAGVTEDLHTAEYLTSLFSGSVSPHFLPEITFLLAALIAFSTGSSWGTMAILYPLMIPTAWFVCQSAGWDTANSMPVVYAVISVVLAGSVFGDHCSPISDTTILSSLASRCNHVEHVKTQLPYAIAVALVCNLLCTNLSKVGLPWYLVYISGFAALWVVIRFMGKPLPADPYC